MDRHLDSINCAGMRKFLCCTLKQIIKPLCCIKTLDVMINLVLCGLATSPSQTEWTLTTSSSKCRSCITPLPCTAPGFVLQTDKEADLLRRGWGDVRMMVGGRGGRFGDLPVAAVEVQGGESRRVVSLRGSVALCRQKGRAQAFPLARLTAKTITRMFQGLFHSPETRFMQQFKTANSWGMGKSLNPARCSL